MEPITLKAPIEHPTVTIGGRVLLVRCTLYAEYCLSKHGLRLADVMSTVLSKEQNPAKLATWIELFAACVADNYKTPEVAPTPDEWAKAIDYDKWPEILKATDLALAKRLRAVVQAQAPPAQAPAQAETALN